MFPQVRLAATLGGGGGFHLPLQPVGASRVPRLPGYSSLTISLPLQAPGAVEHSPVLSPRHPPVQPSVGCVLWSRFGGWVSVRVQGGAGGLGPTGGQTG